MSFLAGWVPSPECCFGNSERCECGNLKKPAARACKRCCEMESRQYKHHPVMTLLRKVVRATPVELAEELGITQDCVSQWLHRSEIRGLVTRSLDASGHRGNSVWMLTRKGSRGTL